MRILKELDAKAFVFENVKGLTVGKQRTFLNELIAAFDEASYTVRTDWKVLDAADYGVPQHRQRLILFGVKKGLKLPEYPKALTVPSDREKDKSKLPWGPTCKDAIGDLPDADSFALLNDLDSVKAKFGKPSPYASEMRCLSNDA